MFWALEGYCGLAPLSDVSVDDFSYTLKKSFSVDAVRRVALVAGFYRD